MLLESRLCLSESFEVLVTPLPCACAQIIGSYEGVKLAARMITDRIRDGVQKSIRPAPSTLALAHLGPPVPPQPNMGMMHPPPFGAPQQQRMGPPPLPAPGGPPPENAIRTEYRLLVPDARVGGLIGKGGEVGACALHVVADRQPAVFFPSLPSTPPPPPSLPLIHSA